QSPHGGKTQKAPRRDEVLHAPDTHDGRGARLAGAGGKDEEFATFFVGEVRVGRAGTQGRQGPLSCLTAFATPFAACAAARLQAKSPCRSCPSIVSCASSSARPTIISCFRGRLSRRFAFLGSPSLSFTWEAAPPSVG